MSLRIEKLSIYPIKSCARLDVPEFQIGEEGPQVRIGKSVIGDREWMFVDLEGKFLTQRSLSKMALLQPLIEGEKFFLQIDGKKFEIPLKNENPKRRQVSVWGKEVDAALVDGPLNQAVSDFLKKPAQLVRFDQNSNREALVKGRGLGVQTRFTDTQPYLILTQESLANLNSKMQNPISDERFRGNILLSGATLPFEEDSWQFVGHENVVFESTKACGRCKIITIDPKTGVIPNSEPLQVLNQFRKRESNVFFGQYFLSRSFGEVIRTGEKLEVQTP